MGYQKTHNQFTKGKLFTLFVNHITVSEYHRRYGETGRKHLETIIMGPQRDGPQGLTTVHFIGLSCLPPQTLRLRCRTDLGTSLEGCQFSLNSFVL